MVIQGHTPLIIKKMETIYTFLSNIALHILLFFTSVINPKKSKHDHIHMLKPPAQKAQVPMCRGGG